MLFSTLTLKSLKSGKNHYYGARARRLFSSSKRHGMTSPRILVDDPQFIVVEKPVKMHTTPLPKYGFFFCHVTCVFEEKILICRR